MLQQVEYCIVHFGFYQFNEGISSAMEKPIVILDYSVDGMSGEHINRWLNPEAVVFKIKSGDMFPSLSLSDYSACIHTGSSLSILDDTSFMDGATRFVKEASLAGVPQMGICYGHQLIARATVGVLAVARSSSIEVGWLEVNFLPEWPVKGLRSNKAVWHSHYDCVVKLPPDSVITASNSHTKIQAFVNLKMKLFGTQFHPEFDRESGNKVFADDAELFNKNGISLEKTLASGPDFETGKVIFSHFLKTFEQE